MEAGLTIQVEVKIEIKFCDKSLHSAYFVILTKVLDPIPLQTYKQTLCLAILYWK